MENDTLDCAEGIPGTVEFLSGLHLEHGLVLIVPAAFCLMTLTVYVMNLRDALRNEHKETKGNVAVLCTIYPIVACSSLVSILAPKLYFFCDTISHISFVIISYQFYRLCINCVDGESKFISISKEETFSLRAPPCCCCCLCLKKSMITKRKFKVLRFLVLQMAVAHVIIFLILNMIAIESPKRMDEIMVFFVPFIASTIILGVWGFQITIRMMVPYYSNLKLLRKFISFQLVLVFCKLQPLLLSLVFKNIIEECEGPFSIIVMIRTITQIFIQVEMFFLSLWARSLYKS